MPLNSIRPELVKKTTNQTLSKALNKSSATARAAPDLLKAQAILSESTVRRSAIKQEDLKPYWKPERRPHLSEVHKGFAHHKKKTNWVVPEITQSLRSEFSEKFSVNNFALSDAEDNSQGC